MNSLRASRACCPALFALVGCDSDSETDAGSDLDVQLRDALTAASDGQGPAFFIMPRDLARYVPAHLSSGQCFPNNDEQSRLDLGCDGSTARPQRPLFRALAGGFG